MRTIITRAGWNATAPTRPFSRRWRTQGIVVHHSGVKDGPSGPKALKAFESWHLGKGWKGIAYNFLIDDAGVIYEGRGEHVVGGATRGWNSKTISVCYTGWGHEELPQPARESLKWLVNHLQGNYKSKLWVKRHRDFASTSCPGDWLASWVDQGLPVDDLIDQVAVLRYLHALSQQVARRALCRSRRSRGDAVKVVQERLKAHGIDTGPIDGMFGPMTDSAVRKFQRLNFLPATGKVNSATWEALLT